MSDRAKLLRRYAANYEEMFATFYKALDADPTYAGNDRKPDRKQEIKSAVTNQINSEISWAKQTFKGNNAWVTWWLRWVRLTAEKMYLPEMFKRDLAQAKTKNPRIDENDAPSEARIFRDLHDAFEHFMTTPAPGIVQYRPEWQTIAAVQYELRGVETEWQEEQADNNRNLKPQDGDEVLMQFEDGWAWWKLNRNRCDEEAKAMGHCGNGGSGDESQRVLSLRQQKGNGWVPHLTFILEGDGFLGEMKGRNNDKPVARYHKYIIPLLESPLIKGIRGGGYLPAHNFSVADLSPEEQDALFAKRPEYMTIPVYYKKFGADETFVKKVIDYFKADHGEDITWDAAQNKFITETWPNLSALIEDVGNDDAKYVQSVLSGNENQDFSSGMSMHDEAKYFLDDDLPSKDLEKIGLIVIHGKEEEVKNWLENHGYDPEDDEFDPTTVDDILSFIDEEGDDHDLLGIAARAYDTGFRYGTEEEMSEARDRAIKDSGYHQMKEDDFYDGPWAEMMDADAILYLINEGESLDYWRRDNEDREITVTQPYNGWSNYESKYALEAFAEEFDVDEKFAEVLGPEAVASFEQEKAREEQYKAERTRLRDDIYGKFKDASPQVKEELNKADQAFRYGDYEPLVKMVQAVIPDAFPFAHEQAALTAQPEPELATA